jgi:hypothetical protein
MGWSSDEWVYMAYDDAMVALKRLLDTRLPRFWLRGRVD